MFSRSFTTFFRKSALAVALIATGLTATPALAEEEMFFSDANMVDDFTLNETRGAAGTLISGETLGIAVLTGVSSNNSTVGNTGSNIVSNSAFDNAKGVAFVVQNTGNNAVINAAMVINLNIQ